MTHIFILIYYQLFKRIIMNAILKHLFVLYFTFTCINASEIFVNTEQLNLSHITLSYQYCKKTQTNSTLCKSKELSYIDYDDHDLPKFLKGLKSHLSPLLTEYKNNDLKSSTLAITSKGLLFYYNSYEIKPYSAGHTRFMLPYDTIKSIIKPEGLLGFVFEKSNASFYEKDVMTVTLSDIDSGVSAQQGFQKYSVFMGL